MTLLFSRIIITIIVFLMIFFVLKRTWTKEVDLLAWLKKAANQIPVKDEDPKIARPHLQIGNRYERDKNAFIISIQTGDNNEIIKKLKIQFKIKGTVTKIKPGYHFNSEPCKYEYHSGFMLNDVILAHTVTLTFENLISAVLNNTIIHFDKPVKANFNIDDRIEVEWYWNYKGESKRERFKQNRNYENKNFVYEEV